MTTRGAVFVLAACTPQHAHLEGDAPPPNATLVVLGHDAASVHRAVSDHAVRLRTHYPFLGATPTWTEERHVLDPEGRLLGWSRTRSDGTSRSMEVGDDGSSTWAIAEGGSHREGTWQLPERPWSWAGPLPPTGPATWWDGTRIRAVQIEGSGETRTVRTRDGHTWTLTGPPQSREVVFDDASRLDPVPREVPPYDPHQQIRIRGTLRVDARAVRELWAAVPPHPIHVSRPLGPEIPKVPARGEVDRPPFALPTHPDPIDLRLPAADDRLLTVHRALASVRGLATGTGQTGVPDAARTFAEGGDCDDLSTLLVAGLAHEGIPAEVVHGWLLDDDWWVRHAWVRVPMAPPTPWLDVDPALGQLPADAARLADDVLPPGTSPRDLVRLILR